MDGYNHKISHYFLGSQGFLLSQLHKRKCTEGQGGRFRQSANNKLTKQIV